ncbi:hypothetical protein HYX13_00695 [Candidatus Woesearchaeota archaeon]|nr:hypothetical protein [Candidatus Woesearchaeota archaeon]
MTANYTPEEIEKAKQTAERIIAREAERGGLETEVDATQLRSDAKKRRSWTLERSYSLVNHVGFYGGIVNGGILTGAAYLAGNEAMVNVGFGAMFAGGVTCAVVESLKLYHRHKEKKASRKEE